MGVDWASLTMQCRVIAFVAQCTCDQLNSTNCRAYGAQREREIFAEEQGNSGAPALARTKNVGNLSYL